MVTTLKSYEKSYRCLVMCLFNYGYKHLVESTKDWWNTCSQFEVVDGAKLFRSGICLELSVCLRALTDDMYELSMRSRFDSSEFNSLQKSMKLISRLL